MWGGRSSLSLPTGRLESLPHITAVVEKDNTL